MKWKEIFVYWFHRVKKTAENTVLTIFARRYNTLFMIGFGKYFLLLLWSFRFRIRISIQSDYKSFGLYLCLGLGGCCVLWFLNNRLGVSFFFIFLFENNRAERFIFFYCVVFHWNVHNLWKKIWPKICVWKNREKIRKFICYCYFCSWCCVPQPKKSLCALQMGLWVKSQLT